jgi:hypothetical protein
MIKSRYLVISIIIIFFIGLSFILGYLLGQTKEKIIFTDTLPLICKIYNETNQISMACNPVDIQKQKSGELVTFGFVLPTNASFNVSKEIYCHYNLTAKRFTYCYQLNIGVRESAE